MQTIFQHICIYLKHHKWTVQANRWFTRQIRSSDWLLSNWNKIQHVRPCSSSMSSPETVWDGTETGGYFILRLRSFQKYLCEVSALLRESFNTLNQTPTTKKRSGDWSAHSSQSVLKRSWLRPRQKHLSLVRQEEERKIPCSDQCVLSFGLLLFVSKLQSFRHWWGEAPMQAPASQIRH